MRAVIDTNVLVSALLTPGGISAQIVRAIRDTALVPVLSHAINVEYAEVLNRARFGFTQSDISDLLLDLNGLAVFVAPSPIQTARLPDPTDAPFIAAAMAAACAVVTGNAKHFPARLGLQVLSPSACLLALSTL